MAPSCEAMKVYSFGSVTTISGDEYELEDIDDEGIKTEIEAAITKAEIAAANCKARTPTKIPSPKVNPAGNLAENGGVTMTLTDEVGEWSKYCMQKQGLNAFPAHWSEPTLLKQSKLKEEKLWKRYFDSRELLISASSKPSPDNFPSESKMEPCESEMYKERIEAALQDEWKGTLVGELLEKHTYVRTTKVSKSQNGSLNDATVVSTIFSPYCLPRAINLCQRYHRIRKSFKCSWHIQFVSLQDQQENLMMYWKPYLHEMWDLCSNEYMEMPTPEVGFMPVENMKTTHLSPNLVRKIRKWLFGSPKSYDMFNDFALLKYLLGTCGTVNDFQTLDGDIGHTWKASEAQTRDMQSWGGLSDTETQRAASVGMNWLEYECRVLTQSLRPVDHWYDPYDQKYHKASWGEAILVHRYRMHGYYEENDDIRLNPYRVWDESVRGNYGKSIQERVMRMIGKL